MAAMKRLCWTLFLLHASFNLTVCIPVDECTLIAIRGGSSRRRSRCKGRYDGKSLMGQW